MRSDKWALGMSALFLGGFVVCDPAGSSASDCDPLPECSGSECNFPLNPAPPTNACGGTSAYTAKVTMTFSQEAGGQRTFFVYRPPVAGPLPLVIVYHGGDDHCTAACHMMTDTHMKEVADEQGFMMLFPLGQHPLPDPPHPPGSTDCHGWGWKYGDYVDYLTVNDVQFTRELIAFGLGRYCMDPTRIYAAGLSQGGFFSYRLACHLSDWIAAVAPIAAGDVISFNPRQSEFAAGCNPPQPLPLFDDCHPLRGVPILHAHGTCDGAVGYYGGGICATWPGAENSTWRWANNHNGCIPPGTVVYNCNNEPGCDVSCTAYTEGCLNGAEVQLCKVEGGGHNWPGMYDPTPDTCGACQGGGCVTQDLDASRYMADFFERFARDPSLVNVSWAWKPNVSAVLNRVAKSGRSEAYDAAAASVERLLSGNGALQVMASETNTLRIIGLNSGPARDLDPATIEYALELGDNGSLRARAYNGPWISGPTYLPGDLLRIQITASQVSFLRNNVEFYNSPLAPQYPLRVRAALYSPQATLGGVVLSGTVALAGSPDD